MANGCLRGYDRTRTAKSMQHHQADARSKINRAWQDEIVHAQSTSEWFAKVYDICEIEWGGMANHIARLHHKV